VLLLLMQTLTQHWHLPALLLPPPLLLLLLRYLRQRLGRRVCWRLAASWQRRVRADASL
jgi:hypothetical protein